MRAFKVFMFGLLYGWFFKMAFDRIYRENELDDVRDENAFLRDHVQTLEMRLQPKSLEAKSLQPLTQVAEAAEMPGPGLKEENPVPPATLGATEEIKDDLKIIKGIGPAFERKLNNAGIFTFAALAALGTGQLESILGSQVKRLQDENNLLAQARKLAKRNSRAGSS